MAEDGDELQDLKILKEKPDHSDKTCEASSGGLNKLPEEKPVNPSSSQVSSLPGTSFSRSHQKYKSSWNPWFSRKKKEGNNLYQRKLLLGGYLQDSLPCDHTQVPPFTPYAMHESVPASRLSPRTDSSSFSSNKPFDSPELHFKNQTSFSAIDLTLSPKRSSSSDTLNTEKEACDSRAALTLLEDIEQSLLDLNFWTPESEDLSLRDDEPGYSSSLKYPPELVYQLPGEKTVNAASPLTHVSIDLPCYSAGLDSDIKTMTSSRPSLGAENSRLQSGFQFPILPYPAYREHTDRDLSKNKKGKKKGKKRKRKKRTSPSDVDNPNHPDLGKQSEMNTELEPQSDPLLTGVGQERNKLYQQEQCGGGYLQGFLPSDCTQVTPEHELDYASRLSLRTDSSLFSSNSSDTDLTSSPKSSSRDRLCIKGVDQVDIMPEICLLLLKTQPPERSQTPDSREGRRKSSCLTHSSSSLNQIISTENSNLKRAASLPNMKLQSSFEEFVPDFTDDEEDGSYRFQCSGPGLYQCRETGLVFDMEAEGEVTYRIVPWNRRSLSQHHKKPAGPLFDISCEQQSVRRLHLPHCETTSTGGCHFLSVAHIDDDEGMELIRPAEITETHVIINITGFSAFGIVKDEDSPPAPVRALVLLFYKPPVDPDAEYQINVLMLPKNVVLRNVLSFRKQLDRGEMFLETPPHCKLQPKQVYTLSTVPGDDSVLVQPPEAEFDEEPYDNYVTAFQVTYEKPMKHIQLFLKDSSSSSIWERRVCLSSSGVKRSCGSTRQNLCPKDLLAEIRVSFIDGVSEPVLKELLDKLLQENVIHDAEKEEILVERGRRDKARRVIDTVKGKGDSASSEMIRCLNELDPFFCEHLGLM